MKKSQKKQMRYFGNDVVAERLLGEVEDCFFRYKGRSGIFLLSRNGTQEVFSDGTISREGEIISFEIRGNLIEIIHPKTLGIEELMYT